MMNEGVPRVIYYELEPQLLVQKFQAISKMNEGKLAEGSLIFLMINTIHLYTYIYVMKAQGGAGELDQSENVCLENLRI